MERKAGRAYRSVLDLVVATCTAALAGAMSVVPPDPRRVAGVVPSASRPCPDVLCTGESRRRQRSDVRAWPTISGIRCEARRQAGSRRCGKHPARGCGRADGVARLAGMTPVSLLAPVEPKFRMCIGIWACDHPGRHDRGGEAIAASAKGRILQQDMRLRGALPTYLLPLCLVSLFVSVCRLCVPSSSVQRPPIPRWCPVRAWLFFTFLPNLT